ncbi:MAG: molybdopterin-guanine dinucleotide biosynthesis protein B [Campylobacterales bacterium]|nr:molybdopterin-guanine dinucleotide biosynthesis protein B [Campylobacterales bacterium]
MKRLAVAFTGPSNSGKTTIIEKIAKILIEQNFKVVIIKNDPKDKAKFDIEGKDSYKFFQTGADVIITSPTRTTLFRQSESDLDELIKLADDFDYLIIEGLKTFPLPRIAVFRDRVDESYFDFIKAVAISDIDKNLIPNQIEVLELNNPLEICDWINKNAKVV